MSNFFLWTKIRQNVAVWCLIPLDNFDLTRKIVIFFSGLKIRENVVVLHCLVFDNFELTEKISKSQKIVKIPIFKAFFYGSIFSWSFDFTLKLRSRHLPELSAEKWSKNQSQSSCKSIINRRNERKKKY